MPPRERPETAAPTKVVKMKNMPAAKPGAPPAPPKLAVGSSPTKPATMPPPIRSAADRPSSDPSEPVTNPLMAKTTRSSPPPPSRPSPMPASAPRISSALVSPAALAARAVGGSIEPAAAAAAVREPGTTVPGAGPEATAIVKALPSPDGSAAAQAVTLPPEGRRRRMDLGKWLVGGAVAAGALVVAILAGAFDRPSTESPGVSAASASDEEPTPREKKRPPGEDPELRSPNDPPRTVGNTPTADPAGAATETAKVPAAEPPPETAKVPAAEPPPETAKAPAAEPPPETAKAPAAEPPPETAKAPAAEPPPETARPAVAAKPARPAKAARPASKPVATKPAAVAAKPTARRKPPTPKPAAKAKKSPTTPPTWDPDSLFPK